MYTCIKVLLLVTLASFASATVIGIDFGTEYFKSSMIKPGKKLAIVENTQSKRMTPNMVAFTPTERLFGADAQTLRVKTPQTSIAYSSRLIGKSFNDTAVQARIAQENWPYNLTENEERGTFNFSVLSEAYGVESIVGMILEDIKAMSEVQSEGTVKDCVITIPPFFTRAQRMILVQVAEAAGLNVISLIHENTAAALYHGIDRMDNETDYFAVIYNLGASYTQVSLVKYSVAEVKLTRGSPRVIENIEVLAHAWDDSLGGTTFDALIAEHFAKLFKEKNGIDPYSNPRATAKLFKKANEVKKSLSAARVVHVFIESLLNGKDLVVTFDRETFEALLEPLVPRLTKPIFDVLEQSGVSISEIGDIELIGGVTRVPKVQDAIKKATGLDLSTHLNGDESMAHGAALFAANYTSEVQLRPMYLSDIIPFDVEGEFYDNKDLSKKSVLFKRGSKLGSKKKVTLTHETDFKASIKNTYEGQSVAVEEYTLEGVTAANEKHSQAPVNHLTFVLTFDGFAYLYEAEARVEIEEIVKEKVVPNKTEKSQETIEEAEPIKSDDGAEAKTEDSSESTQEEAGKAEVQQDEAVIEEPSENELKEETVPEEASAKEETDLEYVERTVKKTVKEKLTIERQELEVPHTLDREQIRSLQKLLRKLTLDDKERKRLAESKNEVEGYIYYLRDKLTDDEFVTVTTEEQRLELSEFLTKTEEWLEATDSTDYSVYSGKTSELKSKASGPLARAEERLNRDSVVEKAYKQIDSIIGQLNEFNKTKNWISVELKSEVYVKANETKAWLEEQVSAQAGLKPSDTPVLTQVKIEAKLHALERSFDIVKRTPRPKAEKKSKLPSDFIKFGDGMDSSNFKFDNITIDGEKVSSSDLKDEL